MSEHIKRLLFTEEPFYDESIIGYILRVAEMNEILNIRWIMKLIGFNKYSNFQYKFSTDFRINIESLSQLTGVDENKLSGLLYFHSQGRTRHIIGNLIIFNQPLLHFFVNRQSPKICPKCLIEQNYCRKVWELSPITICPIHFVLLLDSCPNCLQSLDWIRPKVNTCRCEFDFRKTPTTSVNQQESRLTQYLWQKFGLSSPSKLVNFKYPLNGLRLNEQISLLYLFGSILSSNYGYSAVTLAKHNNLKNHQYLNQALNIFDDWENGYFKLIEQWKSKREQFFIQKIGQYLLNPALPRKKVADKLCNLMLLSQFNQKEFEFLRQEFFNFLEIYLSELEKYLSELK